VVNAEVEPETFEEFFSTHRARVVATLALVTGDEELARDATDEAMARALERWSRVRTMAAPAGWLYTVALNGARREGRRRRRERDALAGFVPIQGSDPPGAAIEIWDLLRTLPERQRLAAVLRYGADLTEVEIAGVMGVTRSTVSATLAAARRSLAPLMDLPDDRASIGGTDG
jgi:RNA polymerase sigma-70 factor (ECF subfamily)